MKGFSTMLKKEEVAQSKQTIKITKSGKPSRLKKEQQPNRKKADDNTLCVLFSECLTVYDIFERKKYMVLRNGKR